MNGDNQAYLRDRDVLTPIRRAMFTHGAVAALSEQAAAAVWNLAADQDNTTHLRELGCVDGLIHLLSVQADNADVTAMIFGAFWYLGIGTAPGIILLLVYLDACWCGSQCG